MTPSEVEGTLLPTNTALESLDLTGKGLYKIPSRIEEFRNLRQLDLSDNQLTTLPPEIGQLTNLQSLDVGENQLTTLPPEIGQLANLQTFSVIQNNIQELPAEIWNLSRLRYLDIAFNQLTVLSAKVWELGELTSLNVYKNLFEQLPDFSRFIPREYFAIHLGSNRLTTLPSNIDRAIGLNYLEAASNKLIEIPPELGGLSTLTTLDLSSNKLTEIPPELGALSNLERLTLSFNKLTGIPPEFGGLSNLESLDLSHNELTTLPPEIGLLPDTIDLRLNDNPLVDPVSQLAARGTRALLTYLQSLLETGISQYEAKLVLVGEGNVGKSSLIAALKNEDFIEDRNTTHGIEVRQLAIPHPVEPVELTLNTWDFGGQEVYRITHQFFFSRRCLYLLVWRPREGQEENALEAWCKRIYLRIGGSARIMIVATHASEGRRAELDYPYLQRQFGDLLVGHWEVDSKTGRGISELRQRIAEHAAELPQMGQQISPRWMAARDELTELSDPHITFERFAMVCARNRMGEEETTALAGLLHDLGQIIHYGEDDGLRDIVVLQPEWLTKAIGYVLEDRKTEAAGGLLDHRRLKEVWQNPERETKYAASLHPYFLRLMEKFDVSYRIPDEDKSLVAQLVPHSQPELPWDERDTVPEGLRNLSVLCEMSEVAPGLVAWLTVRNHRFSIGLHWRRGIFLEHSRLAAQALLRLDDDRRLLVMVRAPSPDYFFSILRDSLEDLIRRRWEGLSYDLLIPCPNILAGSQHCLGKFRLTTLEKYRERDRSTIDCHECLEPQSVMLLLTGFRPADMSLERVLAEVREGFEEARIDRRKVSADIISKVDNQLRVLLRAVSSELSDCPRLFTLLPEQAKGWDLSKTWSDRYRLTLWCEHPGEEHPWDAAQYRFTRPRQWVATVAPYGLAVSRLLRIAVPIGAGLAGVVLPEDQLKRVSDELDLMKTLTEHLLPENVQEGTSEIGTAGWRVETEGAGLRALRALLVELDSTMRFGDLRRVLSSSGDYLWVCPTWHYQQYDPGLPRLPR